MTDLHLPPLRIPYLDDRAKARDVGVHEGAPFVPPTADGSGPEPTMMERVVRGIEAFVDIGVNLGSKLDSLDRRMTGWERLQRYTPVDIVRSKEGTVDSSGDPLVIKVGRPDQGTYWEVQTIVIGGIELNVTAAGSAGVYVSSMGSYPTGITPGLSQCRAYAATLPLAGDWGGRKILVKAGEHLTVVIFGGTANQVYMATATLAVWDTAASLGRDVNVT